SFCGATDGLGFLPSTDGLSFFEADTFCFFLTATDLRLSSSSSSDDLCFAATDGLCFATADAVARKQTEHDATIKPSATNTQEARGMMPPRGTGTLYKSLTNGAKIRLKRFHRRYDGQHVPLRDRQTLKGDYEQGSFLWIGSDVAACLNGLGR